MCTLANWCARSLNTEESQDLPTCRCTEVTEASKFTRRLTPTEWNASEASRASCFTKLRNLLELPRLRHHPGLSEPVIAVFDRGPAAPAEHGQGSQNEGHHFLPAVEFLFDEVLQHWPGIAAVLPVGTG